MKIEKIVKNIIFIFVFLWFLALIIHLKDLQSQNDIYVAAPLEPLCEYNIPVNILELKVVNQYLDPVDGAIVEVHNVEPNFREKRVPLFKTKTYNNGTAIIDYPLKTEKDYFLLLLKNGYEPYIIRFRIPCLGSDFLVNITNRTIGFKYSLENPIVIKKFGKPKLKAYDHNFIIRKRINITGQRDVFYLSFRSEDGIIVRPTIELIPFPPFVPIDISYHHYSGEDLMIDTSTFVSDIRYIISRVELFEEDYSTYEFYITIPECKERFLMHICFDDLGGEGEFFVIDGNYYRFDLEPDCIEVYQSCGG